MFPSNGAPCTELGILCGLSYFVFIKLYSLMFALWCINNSLYTCINVTQNSERICLKLWTVHLTEEVSESESRSAISDSLQPHGLYSPWNSPGQNTGVGNLSLFQGIFPIRKSNQGLLHRRWILYQLSYYGTSNPKTAKYTYSSMKICMSSLGKCLLNIFSLLLIVICFLILSWFYPLYF